MFPSGNSIFSGWWGCEACFGARKFEFVDDSLVVARRKECLVDVNGHVKKGLVVLFYVAEKCHADVNEHVKKRTCCSTQKSNKDVPQVSMSM